MIEQWVVIENLRADLTAAQARAERAEQDRAALIRERDALIETIREIQAERAAAIASLSGRPETRAGQTLVEAVRTTIAASDGWEAQTRDAHNALTSFGVPCEPHQPHDGCDTQLGHRVRLVLAKLSAFSADADAVQNTALDRIAIVKDALETAERERDDAVQAVAEYLSTCNAVLAEHQSVNRLLIAERDAARAQVRSMIGTTAGYKVGCHCNGCRAIAAALGEDCNEPR